jgi:hypothetical protein
MSTQDQHSSQYKEVNQKIRTAASDLRDLEEKIIELLVTKSNKYLELEVLLNERKEIKESNNLIKKSKQWNQ